MLPIHEWKNNIRMTEAHGNRQLHRRRVLNRFLQVNALRGGGEVEHCETLIVGGGITGLYLASQSGVNQIGLTPRPTASSGAGGSSIAAASTAIKARKRLSGDRRLHHV